MSTSSLVDTSFTPRHSTEQVRGISRLRFDVRSDPKAGKQLKTAASNRLVPVHPILKDIGLIAYHRDRQYAGDVRLFPDIELDAFGLYSGRVSRWFSRFLSTCGADAERTCYHSFRHSFRDGLREAGVEREVALRLGGWADSGYGANAVGDGYGRGFSVARLDAAIASIKYAGLDLTYLIEKSATPSD
ncbi:MAG TPA: hypothetical protein PK823_06795 [Novosphingobium sp.]|nr:hypothetical protein [Novosphingobium sp.]